MEDSDFHLTLLNIRHCIASEEMCQVIHNMHYFGAILYYKPTCFHNGRRTKAEFADQSLKNHLKGREQGTLCLQTCFPRAKRPRSQPLTCWCCSQIGALVFSCQAKEELKMENQRLKDENGALIRVITKLSKWGWMRRRRTQSMSLNPHSLLCFFTWSVLGKNVWVVFVSDLKKQKQNKLDCFF